MKLDNIRRVAKEELNGSPSWVDPMLSAYNNFMEKSTQALMGKLTYGDNFLCKILTNQFVNATELVIANPFTKNTRPIGIHPIYIDGNNLIDSYRLTYRESNNELGIKFNFRANDSFIFLTRNANQTIPNNTDTVITWTTSQSLTGNGLIWDSATNPSRITCVNGGNYIFSYTGSYLANVIGQRVFWISKNGVITGTASRLGLTVLINSGAVNYDISASPIISLKPGDYVELWTKQNSGGNLDALGNGLEEVQITGTYLNGNTDISANVQYILIGG